MCGWDISFLSPSPHSADYSVEEVEESKEVEEPRDNAQSERQ